MALLIVEDDEKISNAMREGLELEGYDVTQAFSAEEAMEAIERAPFALILLDIMLPGQSGIEFVAWLRRRGDQTPVLVVSARDAVSDRVLGLEQGADDYLIKPFAFEELLARIKSLLRRSPVVEPRETVVRAGDLEMDTSTRAVRRAGDELKLTAREFELLEYLLKNMGRIVSRQELAEQVWHEPSRHTPIDNVIDVHMARLRKKVDGGYGSRLIETVRGSGFLVKGER